MKYLCRFLGLFFLSTLYARQCLPTHHALMERFQKQLGCSWHDVYIGTTVENQLLHMAGIWHKQSDAIFRRNADGSTYFCLALNGEEAKGFRAFFKQNYRGALKLSEKMREGRYRFTFDTHQLYHRIAPKMGHLPTHHALMERFQKQLGCSWHDVYIGTTVENQLLHMAGIWHKQSDAIFRRNADGSTYFCLALNGEEAKGFRAFFKQNYRGALKLSEKMREGRYRFTFDTHQLYHRIAPKMQDQGVDLLLKQRVHKILKFIYHADDHRFWAIDQAATTLGHICIDELKSENIALFSCIATTLYGRLQTFKEACNRAKMLDGLIDIIKKHSDASFLYNPLIVPLLKGFERESPGYVSDKMRLLLMLFAYTTKNIKAFGEISSKLCGKNVTDFLKKGEKFTHQNARFMYEKIVRRNGLL